MTFSKHTEPKQQSKKVKDTPSEAERLAFSKSKFSYLMSLTIQLLVLKQTILKEL